MERGILSKGFLAVASRSIPAESGRVTLSPFKKGMKVRLSSTEFLHHAYDMVGQTFPKGEIGEVLGQNRQNLVVCFSEESWEVSPDKLRPLKKDAVRHKKRA